MFINNAYMDGQDCLGLVIMSKQAVRSEDGVAVPIGVSVAGRELSEQEPARVSRPRGALALVGAWGEVADEAIDALVAHIYARRAGGPGRRVELAD